MVPELRL